MLHVAKAIQNISCTNRIGREGFQGVDIRLPDQRLRSQVKYEIRFNLFDQIPDGLCIPYIQDPGINLVLNPR